MSNTNYISWKKWDESLFLKYSKEEAGYFERELGEYVSGNKVEKVLEIGFGNGPLIGWLKEKGIHVDGVEIDQTLVSRSKKHGIESFHNVSEIVDKKYDLVIAFDVLEHISVNEIELFFCTIKNILNENGLFISRFPNGDSPFAFPTQNGDLTHITSLGWHRVRYLSEVSGLKMVEYRGEKLYTKSFFLKIFRIGMSLVRTLVSSFFLKVFYPGMPKGTVSFKYINVVAIFKLES